jgi:hypothetical protein
MDQIADGKVLLKECTTLFEERDKVILPVWKQISDVLIPELGDMDGMKTVDALLAPGFYDGKGRAYLEITANAIYSLMMGPGTNWIQFGVDDQEVMKDIETRRYFDKLRLITLDALVQNGFYDIAKPSIKYALSIGTSLATVTREPDSPNIDYIHWHPGDIAHSVDMSNRSNGIVIQYREVPIRDLAGYESLPEKYMKMIQTGQGDKKVKLYMYFRKNTAEDPVSEWGGKFRYTLYHVLEDGAVLHTSGMHSLPGPAWRFEKTPRLGYGLSPGYYILRDMLQLNKIRKGILRETDRQLDPPLWVPEHVSASFFTEPGSIVYHNGDGSQFPRRMFDPADLSYAMEATREIDQIVRQHLLVDFFQALTMKTNRKTAQEVQAMQSEMGAQAAPMVFSVEHNFLRPIVKRTLLHLHEMGKLPEMPTSLRERQKDFPLQIAFKGPLSIANNYLYQTVQAQRVLQEALLPMSQIDPEGTKDALNTAAYIKQVVSGIGGGFDIIRSDAEIEVRARERQQAEQQQMLLEQEKALMQHGSKAPEPGSPMEEVVKQL